MSRARWNPGGTFGSIDDDEKGKEKEEKEKDKERAKPKKRSKKDKLEAATEEEKKKKKKKDDIKKKKREKADASEKKARKGSDLYEAKVMGSRRRSVDIHAADANAQTSHMSNGNVTVPLSNTGTHHLGDILTHSNITQEQSTNMVANANAPPQSLRTGDFDLKQPSYGHTEISPKSISPTFDESVDEIPDEIMSENEGKQQQDSPQRGAGPANGRVPPAPFAEEESHRDRPLGEEAAPFNYALQQGQSIQNPPQARTFANEGRSGSRYGTLSRSQSMGEESMPDYSEDFESMGTMGDASPGVASQGSSLGRATRPPVSPSAGKHAAIHTPSNHAVPSGGARGALTRQAMAPPRLQMETEEQSSPELKPEPELEYPSAPSPSMGVSLVADEQIRELQNQVRRNLDTIRDLQNKVGDAQDTAAILQRENFALETEKITVTKSLAEANEKIQRDGGQTVKLYAEIDELREKSTAAASHAVTVEGLNSENKELKSWIEANRTEAATIQNRLENRILELETKIYEIQRSTSAAEREVQDKESMFKSQTEVLSRTVSKLQNQLEVAKEEHSADAASLKRQLAAKTEEMERLHSSADRRREELEIEYKGVRDTAVQRAEREAETAQHMMQLAHDSATEAAVHDWERKIETMKREVEAQAKLIMERTEALNTLKLQHEQVHEETIRVHQTEIQGIKVFYETQLKLKSARPLAAQSLSDMAQAVESSTHQVDALRNQIKNDREVALKEKEEHLQQRERNLMTLEEAACAHTKRLVEEQQEVQQLVATLNNQARKAHADSVTFKERAAEEQERLQKLQRTLENELEESRCQHEIEMKRCADERRRADDILNSNSAALERERLSLEETRNDLMRQQTDWAAQKTSDMAEVEVQNRRNADEEARLAGERCNVMEEKAKFEMLVRQTERDAEQITVEKEALQKEKADVETRVADVMRLGKLVESQSDHVRKVHAEVLAKHTDATRQLAKANEVKKSSAENLALVEAERVSMEALKKTHELERIEVAQERMKLSEEMHGNRHRGSRVQSQRSPHLALKNAVPNNTQMHRARGHGVRGQGKEDIKVQIAVWEKERASTEQCVRTHDHMLTHMLSDVKGRVTPVLSAQNNNENTISTDSESMHWAPIVSMSPNNLGSGQVVKNQEDTNDSFHIRATLSSWLDPS